MLRAFCGNKTSRRGYQTLVGVFGHKPITKRPAPVADEIIKARAKNCNVYRLIEAYRRSGHLSARINPVSLSPIAHPPELEPSFYDLNPETSVQTSGLIGMSEPVASVEEIVDHLKKVYCGTISSELGYLPEQKKEWLANTLEQQVYQKCSNEEKKALGRVLVNSQALDLFLAKKYPTLKRYGLEGAEGTLAFFMAALSKANTTENRDIVLSMTHRGRANLLTTLLQVKPELLFLKIRGGSELNVPSRIYSGDVLSHIFCSEYIGNIHVSMVPNPSHLEVANPVSMGKARAKQLEKREGGYGALFAPEHGTSIVNVQVHGDAAFAGQGVNQETLALSKAPNFSVGGTVHLVVNNQLGFTTPAERGRSSRYSSDLAKMIEAPVIHVNGEDPEAIYAAGLFAFQYQREMKEDIFVEVHCYRRRGHNELDDPTFTNPLLYQLISNMKSLPDKYAEELIEDGAVTKTEVTEWEESINTFLNDSHRKTIAPPSGPIYEEWQGMKYAAHNITTWDTGFDVNTLRHIGVQSVTYPSSFTVHPHLVKSHIDSRKQMMESGEVKQLDWSTAEALAFGSLLLQGFNVRISGQDVGRGTFSQRHVMLVDQNNGDINIPLNNLKVPNQGYLEVANSILSEEAVLAFEYGASMESPNNLVIWEAQFGDFANCAQSVIDTYVASGEAKWGICSSLTMLLPHGYDGAGPEHSSCRLERFLQLSDSSEVVCDADDINLQIANPSTPAQYFHLLRRQLIRDYRKPLVVVAPKTLLRLAAATSSLDELSPGTSFQNILSFGESKATKVLFTSGKHFYTLIADERFNSSETAIVRLESLSPFPCGELQGILNHFPNARKYVWSQEEPRNQGAWSFVRPRFENLVGIRVDYAGRPALSAPAHGLASLHKSTQESLLTASFLQL